MIEIGKINKLKIIKFLDFGAYLDAGNEVEILLPKRYVTEEMKEGDEVEVFIYTDSEDRLVAVTDRPYAMVNDFALLRVAQVNRMGAFLEWGLPKDLLVPFREQKVTMEAGRSYLVYIFVDDNSKRIVASAKIDKFLDNTLPKYKVGDKVDVIIAKETELGYKVIIDSLFSGLIYRNQTFTHVNIGEHHKGQISNIRRDGKIDVILGEGCKERIPSLSDKLVNFMQENNNEMSFTDKSDPEEIKAVFECSKKDFKKAIGHLFKEKIIEILPEKIILKR